MTDPARVTTVQSSVPLGFVAVMIATHIIVLVVGVLAGVMLGKSLPRTGAEVETSAPAARPGSVVVAQQGGTVAPPTVAPATSVPFRTPGVAPTNRPPVSTPQRVVPPPAVARQQDGADGGVETPTIAPSRPTLPPGITLPRIVTATPLPQKAVSFVIDEQMATRAAQDVVQNEKLPVSGVAVAFVNQRLELSGTISAGFPLPGTLSLSGPLTAVAYPKIEDDELHWTVTSLTLNGRDLARPDVSSRLERTLNDAFLSLLRGRWIQSATVNDGNVTIEGLERQ